MRQGGDLLAGRHVPQTDRESLLVPKHSVSAIRGQGNVTEGPADRQMTRQDSTGAVELTFQVAPFPVTVLFGCRCEGLLSDVGVIELQGADCGHDVGAVALPALLLPSFESLVALDLALVG